MAEDKIAGPHIEVSLDTNQTDAAASKFEGNIDKMVASATKLKNNLDPAERGVTGLTNKIKSLSPEAATDKLNKLALAVERAGGSSVKGAAQLEFLEKRITALQAAGGKVPASLEGIASSTNKISAAMQQLSSSGAAGMIGLPPMFGRVAAAATSAAGLTVAAGAAVVGVGVASTAAAIEFEAAFAKVKRVITPAKADVAALRQGLLDMQSAIPVSAVELSKIASMAGQMGITGTSNILKFTETVARLGVTADMSGEEAAQMLARIAQVNNIPIDKIEHLSSMVLGVGARSNATTSEILRMTMQMQALGSSAGLSAADMIGLSATLASGGVRIESAGTAMGRMARDITEAVRTGGPKLQELAHIAGMSEERLSALWGSDKAATLYAFFQGLHNQGDAATETLAKMGWQGIRVAGSANVLAKTVDELKANITEANTQMAVNTATMEQSNEVFNTTQSSIEKLKGSFNSLGVAIGEGPAVALKGVLDQLISIVNLVNSSGFTKSPLRMFGAAATLGTTEMAMAAGKYGSDLITRVMPQDSMFARHQGEVPNSPMKPRNYLGFDPLSTGFQVAPSAPAGFDAPPSPPTKQEAAALEHYNHRKIELEKEYEVALGKTKTALEAALAAVNAKVNADEELIKTDDKLTAGQKSSLTAVDEQIRKAGIVKAYNDEDNRQRRDKLKLVEASERFTREMADLTDQAAARESTGIERVIAEINAKAAAKMREMKAETDPELRKQHEAEIQHYRLIAIAAAEEHNAMEQRKRGSEMEAESQKKYAGLLDKINPSLKYKTQLLYADISAQMQSLNRQHDKGDIDDETYGNQVRWLQKILGLEEDLLKKEDRLAKLTLIANKLNTVAGLTQELGNITGNESMANIGASAQKGSGLGGSVGSLFGPEGALIGQIAGGLLGGIGEALLGKEPEFKKIMEDVGTTWGKAISEGTAKAIADTESTSKVSRAVAELLNLSKIMDDNPEIDPSNYATKILALADAINQSRAPSKAGIKELGKDFLALKEEADSGSTAARNAMTQLMSKAKELGLIVPEIQAAIKSGLEQATSNLVSFFEGQGTSQRGGKTYGISSKEADANITIFGAVFDASVALNGLIKAAEDTKDGFQALTAGLPEGTKLFGGAAHAAEINGLLENSPLFKGAAQTGSAGANIMGGLRNANALNQNTVDAFSTILSSNYDQALAGTGGLNVDDNEKRKLAEEANLPLLTEMQHARAMGMKLSPEAEVILAKAQEDGMLPALSVEEQQLEVQKQIRDNIMGGNGANQYTQTQTKTTGTGTTTGTSGYRANTGGGPAGGANGTPHYATGGKIPYTPGGGMLIVGGETEDEFVIPKSKALSSFGGNLPSGGGGGGNTQSVSISMGGITIVPSPNTDPVAVGEAVNRAIERDLVPRLRTTLLNLQ